MAGNVFRLDESKQWFIDLGRIDPMTREHFGFGDRVVVCRDCKMVSLESTWNDCNGCTAPGCSCKETAKRFLPEPAPKPQSPADGLNRIVLTNGHVTPADEGEQPRMVIKARHFYN